MAKKESHQILHTFINRHGELVTRVNCGFIGFTDDQAMEVFHTHIRAAEVAWEDGLTWNGVPVRITGIVLINAAENELATWTKPVELGAAA